MTEEQMKRLESIIKNWLNKGAQCNSSLKPYTRSLYPTYNPGIRTKQTDRSRNRRSSKLQATRKSNQSSMIQMCEDFLRNNRL